MLYEMVQEMPTNDKTLKKIDSAWPLHPVCEAAAFPASLFSACQPPSPSQAESRLFSRNEAINHAQLSDGPG